MSEPLITAGGTANERAKLFRDMADRIAHNEDAHFGGAFVLVPPVGAGTHVEGLNLTDCNAPWFWLNVRSIADAQIQAMQTEPSGMWPRR